MSNQNTISGFYNVPAQVVTVSTEVAALVPAAGVYPGLPSPTLPVGSGLSIAAPQDITGFGSDVDLRVFRIRLCARVANPGAGNFTLKMYQVSSAGVGVIAAAGGVTSAGAVGTASTAIDVGSAAAAGNPSIFVSEYTLLWSFTNATLGGTVSGFRNASTIITPATISAPNSTTVATVNQLNFMPSYTFATANAANSVQISEFVIERV